jgi:hypothetical protein
MNIYNSILKDFKENILEQFIGVITFGFGVTAFFKTTSIFITNGIFSSSINDIIFLLLCFICYIITQYSIKEKTTLKEKILKSTNFIFNLLGFVLMFVPLIIIFEKTLEPVISYESIIIKNSIISLILSIVLFLVKSIVRITA